MDEGYKNVQQTSETTNVLPDIVHAEQATVAKVASDDNRSNITKDQSEDENTGREADTVESKSESESISEHIAKGDSSISESEAHQSQQKSHTSYFSSQNVTNTEEPDSKNIELSHVTEHSEVQSQNVSDIQSGQPVHSIASPSLLETNQESWNVSDVHISEESPVVLASSDLSSRDITKPKSLSPKPDDTPILSPQSVYLDSLNEPEEDSQESPKNEEESLGKCSSGSEEIIKLDIRGQAAPKFQYEAAKIIFGPPPENSTIIGPGIEPIPIITNLLSPCFVTNESVQIQEVYNPPTEDVPDKSITPPSESSSKIEQDVLVEEILVQDITREDTERHEEMPKSFIPEENISYSTLSTDYKTICEEYNGKLMHLEEAIIERNKHIEDLKVSLQKTLHERDSLREENDHLTTELQNLQHIIGERPSSDHDTVKGQLSDFIKYQSMIKDDTKFYSALLSGSTSLQSSNGEKDMDREEITIDHSKSDIRTSTPEELESELEKKLISLLNTFEESIEDNIKNKLKESLMQFMINENIHANTESDTINKLEMQMKQEIHENMLKVSQLRELLTTVKAGSADIDKLREELNIKHEEDLNNLRKYYEQKCADVAKKEEGFSEDVDRSRSCASPEAGAGDARPFRSLTIELSNIVSPELEAAVRRYERQLEELKQEHVAYVSELQARQRETVLALEDQITQLKAHIQTSENTEPNEYPQDIDLELEKDAQLQDRDERVRKQTIQELGRKLEVLLSDPDAELSSWPLELVTLRDKIQPPTAPDTRPADEKECSAVREESPADGDRWRQRRNNSFDQNRQLEELTKERDELRATALMLQCAVSQLVAYCASAEDELNRTVLHNLLRHFAPDDSTFDDSRPSSPGLDVSRRVHFAPRLDDILATLDESAVAGYLRHQRDLGASIKAELELSLRRLRTEAHELLQLSDRLTTRPANDSKMIECSPVKITEMVEEYEKQKDCENCQYQKKCMGEAMEECMLREAALRAERDAAMLRLATLGDAPPPDSPPTSRGDVIEGYGVGAGEVGSAGGSRSLESARSPREQLAILTADRDDLRQQLESASAQLRSTRKFVEEQAAEREQEHEEWAASLEQLREENARLATRLSTNARIVAEVEQLENEMRKMNQIIADLEARKSKSDEEAKASEEQIAYLREVIDNLENKLEQKTSREAEVLKQLEEMKRTIDERDSKIRVQLGELDSLRSERAEQSDYICPRCTQDDDKYNELLNQVKEEAERVARWVCARRRRLERAHERVSPPTSDQTEDVSLRDRQDVPQSPEVESAGSSDEEADGAGGVLSVVWAALSGQARAADAALKRIADLEMQRTALKDMAQEVRAERDVLQARMSEQALRLSSLSARLQRQRADADALAHAASSALSVQLSDAHAEVQRLKEELESKDKQLARLKQGAEERDRCHDKHQPLYGNLCNPKDKVVILEKALSEAQSKIAELEEMAQALESEKEALEATVRDQQRAIADKEEQLNEIMALKLEEEEKERSEVIEAKASARTLSDIVSISEYDEDLQMRRAEVKNHSTSFTQPDKLALNKTLPPDAQPNMSSLHADFVDHFDFKDVTPHADSLPVYLTSTQNREVYKRSVNEMTAIGSAGKDSLKIPDNCSIYPNRDISDSKNISVEPKKINFSLEPSDNKTHDEEFPSLQELGITLDMKRENFPNILTQLKQEINKAKSELQMYKSQLKNAEEQLCEFPALKKEVEELKTLLDNTVAAMENDKKFYENQLESFSVNKKLLEQRLTELTREAGEKSKDLHLLKEDILRRENMILELAKEKRNLTSKIAALESRIEELQSKNVVYETYEIENKQMKEKMNDLNKLEQLVSEKNQQIDSLNQHLDRLDDLQRRLNDKNEELEQVKEALEEKTNELQQLQDSISELNRDIAKVIEENDQLSYQNNDLKQKLSKIEKEQENASLKLQKSDNEVERLNSLNNELTSRIDEMKQLNQCLKDKETEIEILHEDMDVYHNEIALLKEQLKMISRSPSPRTKVEDKMASDRQAASDKKQLVKIKKQISHLQHELDFNKKDLNDKAFELAKAKLDLTEMKANLSQATKAISEMDASNVELLQQADSLKVEINKLKAEKQQLSEQLAVVVARIREESNVTELKEKLKEKTERCQELEVQLMNARELVDSHRQLELDRHRELNRQTELHSHRELTDRQMELRSRSPTAELEQAVRAQLDYSHALDHQIVEHILSANSDDRDDIPRLALNSSRSSSVQSTSSERYARLRADSDKLQLQVNNLECRLQDKDALIAELNRVRDQLSSDLQCAALRYEAERDNSARLALLLDSQKESSAALHQQDSNVISLLQRRLESAMRSDERAPPLSPPRRAADDPRAEAEWSQLRSSISVLRAQLEAERRRCGELRAHLDTSRAHAERDGRARDAALAALRAELAELRRLKRESCEELARCRELLRARTLNDRQVDGSKTPRFEVESPELTRLKGRPTAEDKDQAIRFLQARCLLLESWRKALVWQKRYLQRSLAPYHEMEARVLPPATRSPIARFRTGAWCVVAALRLRFVAARRMRTRAHSTDALLRVQQCSSPLTPLSREVTSLRDVTSSRLRRDTLTFSPALGYGTSGDMPRSPLAVDSPHREPFLLNPVRGESTRKLCVSRCLTRAMESARDVP
ncbi:golgin subfamily A member 4-like isoform X2 [Aricia agestis]|uniref:golgin subfamily A member 4-like isoform X2 n=1 Tax=Aricia agestis TaxID=91739 RepID=UPI001C20AF24|nr:golgin subfamily A member 4-like isoform X2 [Aricia agestis]